MQAPTHREPQAELFHSAYPSTVFVNQFYLLTNNHLHHLHHQVYPSQHISFWLPLLPFNPCSSTNFCVPTHYPLRPQIPKKECCPARWLSYYPSQADSGAKETTKFK